MSEKNGFEYILTQDNKCDTKIEYPVEPWLGYTKDPEGRDILLAEDHFKRKIEDLLITQIKGEYLPDIIIPGIEQHIKLIQPEFSFRPDLWSLNVIKGLLKGIDEGILKTGEDTEWIEIGPGIGINEIALLLKQGAQPGKISITDTDGRQNYVTKHNIAKNCGPEALNRISLSHAGDLLKNIPEEKKFDVIFACIPQVPCLKEFAANTQEISNYFNPDDYKNYYNDNLAMLTHLSNRGLVLNDVLLQQSRQRLKEGGKVVLNLAGRAGESDINTIFERNGFHKKQILHSEVIQQHPQTSIENFANTEEALHQNFCFYSDSEGKEPIGAQLAHELMLKNKPVYHKIYAISAELDN